MPKFDPEHYLDVETYSEGLDALHKTMGVVLFSFGHHQLGDRDIIIRNFIARADMIVRAVFRLWEMDDYQDCWALYRCLLDRLFHLHYLSDSDAFETFEAWSFLQQYNAVNRARSDARFGREAVASETFAFTTEQKERARKLSRDPPKWSRPFPEDVAKLMGMDFLYRFGYDPASSHVHPMANDGVQDFHTITGVPPATPFPDQRSVLSNSLLVGTMVVQEGLNVSRLSWIALVYDLLEDLRRFIGTGTPVYRVNFLKVGRLIEEGIPLSAKR